MKLRNEEGLFFTWKVVDTMREPGDPQYIRFYPSPDGYLEVDYYEVTAIAFEKV